MFRKVMMLLCVPFVSMVAVAEPSAPGAVPDVRITVKAVSAGADRSNKSVTSSRRLEIHLENREHRELTGLKIEWKIVGEDIRNDRKSVESKGTKEIKLDADGKLDVESGTAKFTEKEGEVKVTGKGKNKRRTVGPDTGKRYAGYVVELFQNGKRIAGASTNGIEKQIK
ncbi:MAG: hypothetical protein J0M04_01020 [Verrucomicrobia bacterium]|nr:hypothetical protein [Verrucomicrobiota bacterium]